MRSRALSIALVALFAAASLTPRLAVGADGILVRDPGGRWSIRIPAGLSHTQPVHYDGQDCENFIAYDSTAGPSNSIVPPHVQVTHLRVYMLDSAAGGLYDAAQIEMLLSHSEAMEAERLLPAPSPDNLCAILGAAHHWIAPMAHARPGQLTEGGRMLYLDEFRHGDPAIVSCRTDGHYVIFHLTCGLGNTAPQVRPSGKGLRMHVYGVIRFLRGATTSVQVLRTTFSDPEPGELAWMRACVESFVSR